MKRMLAGLVAALLFACVPTRAEDHLVAGSDVSSALQAADRGRAADLARLEGALATPAAARAAAVAGAKLDALRPLLSTLSDSELRDLAARAAALEADPVAGTLDPDIRQLLIIFLIVAIVILVLQAVD